MRLLTDIIDPAPMTGFARDEADYFDARANTLASVFPNVSVNGIHFEWKVNGRAQDVAAYRSFDAESKIGSGSGLELKSAKLAPLSIKKRFSEYDQIIRMGANAPESVQAAADRLITECAEAIVNRLIQARGQALSTGKLVLNEDGLIQTVDFARRSDFTTAATDMWNASTPGDPIKDLEKWRDAFVEENGREPDRLLLSRKVMATLMRSEKIRAYLGSQAPEMVTEASVAQILQGYGFPTPEVFNRRVLGAPVLPENKVFFVADGAGVTAWGTTVESSDSRYALPFSDQPGLVAGMYAQDDPAVKWIRAAATALPILGESNLTLAATVLE